jgi:hypothetical protein
MVGDTSLKKINHADQSAPVPAEGRQPWLGGICQPLSLLIASGISWAGPARRRGVFHKPGAGLAKMMAKAGSL